MQEFTIFQLKIRLSWPPEGQTVKYLIVIACLDGVTRLPSGSCNGVLIVLWVGLGWSLALGLSWGDLRASWGGLGRSWGHLWALLGRSWAVLGASWAILGRHPFCGTPGVPRGFLWDTRCPIFCALIWAPSWCILGLFWVVLGPSWPLLGRSWPLLGVILVGLGRSWGPIGDPFGRQLNPPQVDDRMGSLGVARPALEAALVYE
jgi:hypothetical protein